MRILAGLPDGCCVAAHDLPPIDDPRAARQPVASPTRTLRGFQNSLRRDPSEDRPRRPAAGGRRGAATADELHRRGSDQAPRRSRPRVRQPQRRQCQGHGHITQPATRGDHRSRSRIRRVRMRRIGRRAMASHISRSRSVVMCGGRPSGTMEDRRPAPRPARHAADFSYRRRPPAAYNRAGAARGEIRGHRDGDRR